MKESESRRQEIAEERVFQSCVEAAELFNIYLGHKLNLYSTMDILGSATSLELAQSAGTDERMTREWLEQQTVCGNLEADDPASASQKRRYRLAPGHRAVLVDVDSISYSVGLVQSIASIAVNLPALLEAFRTGRGVSYGSFSEDARQGQEFQNRATFKNLLGQEWLPSIPDVHSRLLAEPPAHVADFGCGAGWSSIAIAETYPNVVVDGFDLDEASIIRARLNAAEAGLSDRVRFHLSNASDPNLTGRYDLVTAFECIHDLSQPVEALRVMRNILAPKGTVIVMDERTAEAFTAPGDQLERTFYAFSVLFCLPVGMAEGSSAGTGTVMRPDTFRRYAFLADFRSVEILPIEHRFFRFYRLMP